MAEPARARAGGEAALAAHWASAPRGPFSLEDGRPLRIVFPGIPGGGDGPDFRGAVLEAGGDLLRGDVELHLKASGWRAHGHHRDPAYAGVVLHVVAENDAGATATLHVSGRAIPILVLYATALPAPMAGFVPPCALLSRLGTEAGPALDRLALRRLRQKALRLAPVVARDGPGQALYAATLETLAGPANRAAFASLAWRLPLAALLERAEGLPDRPLALAAQLKREAAGLALRRAGLRPLAAPGARLEAASRLFAAWWPAGPGWPVRLDPGAGWRAASAPGVGRGSAIELITNAVAPAALAAGLWSEAQAAACWAGLPTPGTYGKLRPLEGWLGSPFGSAASLQGGLLLHADYCTRGFCGRCPLSGSPLS